MAGEVNSIHSKPEGHQEWSSADLRQILLDVDLLRAFVAVVDYGGYTTAAQALYKTQSAVSLQIKRLEEQVGVQLFEMPRRKIVLTKYGERFLPHARRAIRSNIEAINSVADGRSLKGRVKIGTNQLHSVMGLPEVFSSFYAEYAGVQIELSLGSRSDLREGLGSKYDIVLNVHPAEDYSGTVIARQRPIWAGSAKHETHRQEPLPVAFLPSGALVRDMALNSLSESKKDWRLVYESSDLPALMATVAAGMAVTVCFPPRLDLYIGQIRELGHEDGFMSLPDCVHTVEVADDCTSAIAPKLAEYIARHFQKFDAQSAK